jgi:hypothetical protein
MWHGIVQKERLSDNKGEVMKKILFISTLLTIGVLGVFTNSIASSISIDPFITADDVTITHLETMRSTFQGAINSPDGALIQAGTITDTSMDDNTSPVNRWDETFNDFVYTGLTIPTSTDLNSTTTAGTAYVQGVRVVKDATPHEYTASKHTYIDLSKTGTFTYTVVAVGAVTPDTADNSIRLAKVSTDTSKVAVVDDLRVTTVSLGTESAVSLVDTDQDTQVQVEKNSDEDIIRFDTAGTERALIDSNGLGLKGSTSGTTTITASAAAGTTTFTLPAITGTAWVSGTANVNTSQPAFLVKPTSNQENMASSAVTVIFGTEVFDQANNFASNTFTAPVTGKYQLSGSLYLSNIDTGASYTISLVTSNRNYVFNDNPQLWLASDGAIVMPFSVLADMDINDTAYIVVNQGGGAQQTDVTTESWFSGFLVS